MKKRVLSLIATISMAISLFVAFPMTATATSKTAADAIAWVVSQVGHSVGYNDGSGYYQCVEFIQAYYQWLGVSKVSGNGADYATNALPSGWTRTAGGKPQKGDILVYSSYSSTVQQYGHVAIYESDSVLYDQDGSVYGATVKKENKYYKTYTYNYWGCIHPNFASSPTPVDLGTDYYAYIFNQPCWKTVACETNGYNVYLETEKWTANQRWYVKRNDDCSYTFINAANNRCLDVASAGNSNLTNVQVYTSNGTDAQKWFIYSVGDKYVLSPKCAAGKVLDLYSGITDDGTNVQIYDENDSNAQLFVLYKVEAEAGKPQIQSNVTYMKTSGTATISWNPTTYTDRYNYFLTEYPQEYGYTTNVANGYVSNNYVDFGNLTNGNYTCFIHAVSHQNKWGAQSNWVSFNVYEDDYVPTKTVVYNNHIYALYDYEMAWDFAKRLCTDLGGHLVTITNAEENQVITELIQFGSKDAYWLGATDINDTDKNYKWVTGENFSYNNWASSEPSSTGVGGTKEHFAEIRKSYGNKWNDVYNINKSNKGFILEVEIDDCSPTKTQIFNGNKYMIFDKNTTWSEAKVICEQLGGHLVTLESEEEQNFLKNFLKSGNRYWYYLGAQKENEIWKWYNGKTAEYIPFADNASQWGGSNLMMYKSTGNCIGINNAYYPENDISNIGFICECENAAPIIEINIKDNTSYSAVNATIGNAEIGSQVIFAIYKDNKLIDLQTETYEGENVLIETSVDYDRIKAMLWDNMHGMKPLCPASVFEIE